MKYLLICPGSRERFQLPGDSALPLVPMLGQTLLEYWLSHLSAMGTREVTILADTALDEIRKLVGGGERWGLKAAVQAESRELSVALAGLKYGGHGPATEDTVVLLDHFPGHPNEPLFNTYEGFFRALQAWIPSANTLDRVGVREMSPGVWVGHHTRIASTAVIEAPCWIGQHCRIEDHAVIAQGSVIENGVVTDQAAEIRASHVGPRTYVGKFADLNESFAWGDTLLNWRSGSVVRVPDPFMLCALSRQRSQGMGLLGRLNEAYARNKVDAQMLWKHLLTNREG
jgi:NDP-sugar pyrophosphorylase family protein